MSDKERTLKIGPVSREWLNQVGIHTLQDLEAVGAVEAYLRVKAVEPRATLNLLYGLQAVILNIHWTMLPPDMKEDLKRQVKGE